MKNDELLEIGDTVVVNLYYYHNTEHEFDDNKKPALEEGREYIVEAIDRSSKGSYPRNGLDDDVLGEGYTIKIGGRAFGSVAVSLVKGALQRALEVIYKD